MTPKTDNGAGGKKNVMTAVRASDREFVVKRMVDASVPKTFAMWTKANVFEQWWVPESFRPNLVSCDLDVREGGTYRLVFRHPDAPEPMAFHGRYLEVIPNSRLVWTNEEAGGAGQVTTVVFEDKGGKTQIVVTDLYPSKEALDAAISSESVGWNDETFDQLERTLTGRADG